MNGPTRDSLIERVLPASLLIAFVVIALLTLYPFLPAILWGTMLAIAVEPRYRWLTGRLGGRPLLAAWLSGIYLLLLFVLPALGLARALLAFVPDALDWVERVAATDPELALDPLHELPAIGPHIASMWQALFSDASGVAEHFRDELKTVLVWALQEVELIGIFVFEFAIGVILAAVLVYRSERISELAHRFLHRIGGDFAQRLAAHSVVTTRLAVRGVLGAALAQTLVATFSYVVAGVPHVLIWAGVTFVLSLIQIGPALVWLPMSIWLWSTGNDWMAAFIFVWGLVVVNLTDNLVRPLLVSKEIDLPATLAFLGAVGGLLQWGVVGVFLGPVIMAVGYELLMKWIEPETLPESVAD